MLGAPMETQPTAAGILLRYYYQAASPDQRSGKIDITFTLNPATSKLRRIQGRVFDVVLDVEFPDSAPALPAGKQPAAHDSGA
jgi:hypothetical protein